MCFERGLGHILCPHPVPYVQVGSTRPGLGPGISPRLWVRTESGTGAQTEPKQSQQRSFPSSQGHPVYILSPTQTDTPIKSDFHYQSSLNLSPEYRLLNVK